VPSGAVPVPGSPLIGRDEEVAQVIELLECTSGRVVTITGPGGCGKTHLALEVIGRVSHRFADGARFVSLTAVRDPSLVASEVARALGVPDQSGGDPVEHLGAALRHQRLLLVLDSFEHVVGAATVVAQVLARCAGVIVLVTSRRSLRLAGESTMQLAPLELPPPTDGPLAPDVAAVPSVALFCTRATAVNSRFQPTAAALAAVARICRLLDGLPLAIELAAAYARVLSPEALLTRLEPAERSERLDLLGRGTVDAEARHRGVREAVQWSYDLLDEPARRLLRGVSVFDGDWSLDAMEVVCADPPAEERLLDALTELVDLHLVEPVDDAEGPPRYRLLETVRDFAWERLREPGDDGAVAERHTAYFVALATEAGAGLESRHEQEWIRQIDRDLPNLRTALDRLEADCRLEEGLAAACALAPFWLDRGPAREGRERIERFLAGAADAPPPLVARGVGWSTRLGLEHDYLATTSTDDDPIDVLERAARVLDAAGDLSGWLRSMDHLTYGLRLRGDAERFERLLAEALTRCEGRGAEAWLRADLLHRAAAFARDRGDPDRASELARSTVEVARAVGNERSLVRATLTLAMVGGAAPATVRAHLEEALERCEDIGDRRGAAMAAAMLGGTMGIEGDARGSMPFFLRAIELGRTSGYWHAIWFGLMGVTGAAGLSGQLAATARLHGALGDALPVLRREIPPTLLADYDRVIDHVRTQIGELDFDAQRQIGAALDSNQAIEVAQSVARSIAQGGDAPEPPPRRKKRGPRANPELTERELEVLAELVHGHTNHGIAVNLDVSPKTVMHHTVSVYRKLGVRGRAEAVAHALRAGLVPA
jgi:predicted ATPase/DNA-binding CsgD family transcriptional regulator